ncbi:MAG: hypothetical protein ACRC46_08755 [Thermoguttaceae bacterium]
MGSVLASDSSATSRIIPSVADKSPQNSTDDDLDSATSPAFNSTAATGGDS